MPLNRPAAGRRRTRARLEGIVQGVGFRPYVHGLTAELELAGEVFNDEHGVIVEVEGPPAAVDRFLARLPAEIPPLAAVESMRLEELPPTGQRDFAIGPSASRGRATALVAPDTATCEECLRELLDPADRRFRYPFINCTNCGPRFTIIREVPYDRARTTMAGFSMCERCRAEYEDPGDRRFHAQPNACPACGPAARLVDRDGDMIASGDPVAAAAKVLDAGSILAVKGIGGFHLACRADHDAAVASLRARKHREHRPFALMAADLPSAEALVHLEHADAELLTSRARPIVVAPRRAGAAVAQGVAPGTTQLGVMLPYSPLHHLLLADAAAPLVMTSGNLSDEPIAFRDGDALARLGRIADAFLVHDRPIETRTDDSVVATVPLGARRRSLMLRRSRGHVPAGMRLPVPAHRPIVGCGAELKNAFCVARGRRAWVGPHIGDLKNYETLRSFEGGIRHLCRLFDVTPAIVAHDLHPDYLSTAFALAQEGVDVVGVQHHHAHLAACLAEHGERGPAVGAIFDGTGYGVDGSVWGGELLIGGVDGFTRAGHLLPVRMPGGDQAVRQPWRMACAWLDAAGPGGEPDLPSALAGRVDAARWRSVAGVARSGLASPWTTSMGRLFDAVAALCGFAHEAGYEGQAAIQLEAAAEPGICDPYPLGVTQATFDGPLILDARETVRAVARDAGAGVAAPKVSARFHAAVAEATADACERLARGAGLETVVLSGGVFQNRLLLERTVAALVGSGLRVLVPEALPPNDGGISYGQVAVAAALTS